jgi:capsular exopolysaccharide synthesis family protein
MTEAAQLEEMTLRDYASVLWRRKWIVLLPVAMTTLLAIALSTAQTPMYRASAQVLVKTPATAYSLGSTGDVLSPRLVENELQAAKGSELIGQLRTVVGIEPALSVSVSEGSDVFTFTASSASPELAAAAANAYAREYIDRQRTLLLEEYAARVDVLTEQLAAIERGETDASRQADYEFELQDLAVSIELARTSGSTLIDEAMPPSAPYEPNTMRTATLAAVVGLLIGLGAAFMLDYIDTSVRDEEDLVRVTGLPNLATIPNLPPKKAGGTNVAYLVTREHPHSPASEAFRSLETAIKFLALERTLHTLLVTSPRPGEGKTTTATNLAISAAKSGQRVLLVDCDLRKPQAHLFFELQNDQGFTSVLLGEATMRGVAQMVTDASKLAVITSGPIPPNASELLAGERTKASLEALSKSVDLVIVDSPPVLPVSDPLILASLVDGVIVVASAGTTDRRQLAKTIDRLAQVEAPVLGTVLNRYDPIAQSDYTYGYSAPTVTTSEASAADDRVEVAAGPTGSAMFERPSSEFAAS